MGIQAKDGPPVSVEKGEWEDEKASSSPFPLENSREVAVVALGFCVALTCGTPNAWSLTGGEMQDDLDLTDNQVNLITSFGLLGLYFTFAAGFLYDFIGVAAMVAIGCVTTSGGYLIMSFGGHDSWLLILIAFTFVGFGSGGAFIAVLGFGLKTVLKSPGFAVSTIGGGMSLSMAFVTVLFIILRAASCDGECEDGIWRAQLRLLAVVSLIVEAPAACALYYLEKKQKGDVDHDLSEEKEEWEMGNGASINVSKDEDTHSLLSKTAETWKEKLSIMKHYFFWVLFCTYAIGIGGCLVVLTEMVNIWNSVVENAPNDRDGWVFPISLSFSLVNCFIGGILFGFVTDRVVSRGLDRTKALSGIFLIFSFVFFALAGTTAPTAPPTSVQVMVMILIISIGIAFGTMVNTFPTLVGENYDLAHFGLYLGLLQIGVAAATFLVPVICTLDYNKTGSFFGVFCLFGFLYLGSGLVLFFVKPPSTS